MTEPNLTLSDSTSLGLPLRWAVVIIGTVLVLGSGVGVAQVRLSSAEERVRTQGEEIRKLKDAAAIQSIRDAEVKKDLEYLKAGMDALTQKVDRALERRGVRTAGGER